MRAVGCRASGGYLPWTCTRTWALFVANDTGGNVEAESSKVSGEASPSLFLSKSSSNRHPSMEGGVCQPVLDSLPSVRVVHYHHCKPGNGYKRKTEVDAESLFCVRYSVILECEELN